MSIILCINIIDGGKNMDETLSVGLYNYRILDVKSLNRICKKIENAISVFNIYPYFENTTNVLNVDNRNTFERMLLDYKVSYIDIVVFDNFLSLGKSEIIQGQLLKRLIDEKIHFIVLDENIDSNSELGKELISLKIAYAEKQRNELASKIS